MSRRSKDEEKLVVSRRAFLRLGGMGFGALLMGWASPFSLESLKVKAASSSVTPRGTARNVVFIFLRGGASHIDTFDLKVGKWTPNALGVEQLNAGYKWPSGIFPSLAKRTDKFSLVRSLQHQEAVHDRAEYYVETGRRLNPGLRQEIPSIGSVVALEYGATRKPEDIFPDFLMISPYSYQVSSNGFLPQTAAPFRLIEPYKGIKNLRPFDGDSAFDRRRNAMHLLDGIGDDINANNQDQFSVIQGQAERLLKDPATSSVFSYTSDDAKRYGDTDFGLSMVVARNVLMANRGTRYIGIDSYSWDHHTGIYDEDNFSLLGMSRELDRSLGLLIDDLSAAPGTNGKSLFDETLIVVCGEFGRTVGPLHGSGRDHYPYAMSALMAGGGVQGGRVIGSTDDQGAAPADFGWSHDRPIHLPDLAATIYSAMGIDWTKSISNTPSGRIFRYTDPVLIGDDESYEISPLF